MEIKKLSFAQAEAGADSRVYLTLEMNMSVEEQGAACLDPHEGPLHPPPCHSLHEPVYLLGSEVWVGQIQRAR
jgi:uncharacterized metal-binding protein YceD (DUF177 family)